MMDKNILFIGNFLSKNRGTKGIIEKIALLLKGNNYNFILVSYYQNRILRLLNIMYVALTSKISLAHIDVFSYKSFRIAQISALILRIRKKKYVLNLRGGALSEYYSKHPNRCRYLFKNSTKIISPSMYLRNEFTKHGFNVGYLPNFVDLNKFEYNRDHVIPESLLWVRAFGKQYRPELAILTLHRLKQDFPNIKLTMIGPDQGMLKHCQELIRQNNLAENINIIGPVSNDNLSEYYQTYAIYLNTTIYESFGVAVMEAASCGIPIVSTSVGEIPLLWEAEKEILLVEIPNEINMAHQVKRILNDKKISQKLSMNARKKAENYSWEKVKGKWIELFN